tara:strand:- start:314 stop:1459 length:1146 start_codon:yes stop_codon:yes gene_type:complete
MTFLCIIDILIQSGLFRLSPDYKRCSGTMKTWWKGLSTSALVTAATCIVMPVSTSAEISADQSAATIIMYHRFGEEDYPSTNVRVDQFESHIRELVSGRYSVLPLEEIIDAFRSGRALPQHTVAITIDDAYQSIYTVAFPRLTEAGLPFTVFVATDPIDAMHSNFMTWDQIREIRDAGGNIGHHTASHLHMADASVERIQKEISKASERYKAELGEIPRIFAYPYGEASLAIRRMVVKSGFIAALGQHSGVAHAKADQFYLPRFPLNENFGSIDRLKLVVSSLPLPVFDITPLDYVLKENPPHFGFSVSSEINSLERLNCFAFPGIGGPVKLTRLGDRRIEIRINKTFPPGRARFNCTLPAPNGQWRWFGTQFYVPHHRSE